MPYDEIIFYGRRNKKDYTSISIDIITPQGSYTLDKAGNKTKSDTKYSSFISMKPDNMHDINGVGLSLMQTVVDLQCTAFAYKKHMKLLIDPPLVFNANGIPEDEVLDRRPEGVTKLAQQYGEPVDNHVAMILDKYHNILEIFRTT